MQTNAPMTGETHQLRRTLRDMVALSTLPAVWAGCDSRGIAESLADVLVNTLSLDLVYLRLKDAGGLEVARGRRRSELAGRAAITGETLAPFLEADPSDAPAMVPDPLGDGTLRVVRLGLEPAEADGFLIAGSRQLDFPSESARLLLRIAANQAAMVIQRKRTEERVHESERRLREMIDALPAAIYTTDAEGRLTHFNPACVEFSGRVPELGSDNWCVAWKLFRPDGRPMPHDKCPMALALKEGRDVRGMEAIAERPDGKRIWFAPYPTPLRDPEGRIVGGINMLVDITESKQAEAALRRSEQELADFFDNATVGLHWVGPDGTILRVNQAELNMLGYSGEEYTGHHIAEFHVDQDVIADILRRLSAGETVRDCEARMRRKDGSIKHVLIDSSVRWQDGQFIHTRCFTRDITDRKRVEEAQARLAAIVESSEDAIVGKTCDGYIQSWNASAERLFGYTAAEAIGRSIRIIVPPDREDEERLILERLRRGSHVQHYDTVHMSKDGRRIDVSLTVSPIIDRTGRVIAASTIARDITDKKRDEQRLLTQYSVTRALADSATLSDAAPKILRAICGHLGWDVGILWYVDRRGQTLRCAEQWHSSSVQAPQFAATCRMRTFEPGIGLPGRVWRSSRAEWIPDVVKDDNFRRASIAAVEGLHGAFGFPIVLNEEVFGVIEFFSPEIRQPDEDLLQMMTAIGSQIGQFIERKRAEEALRQSEQMSRFLADASATLAELTDYKSTLQRVAALAVPAFADWCAVDMQHSDGSIDRLAVTHTDPAKVALAQEMFRRYPPEPSDPHGVMKVLRTGAPEWFAAIPDFLILESAKDEDHLRIIRQLGLKSFICAPLRLRGKTIGVLTFATAESGRIYEATDVAVAEDLAHRAVIAIENANLLATIQESDRRKDEFLATLAHELRNPLAPVRNAVQLLRLKGSDEPELRWSRDVIERQVEHLTRLIDDLLEISRITRNKLELRKQRVELAEIINGAVESSRPVIEQGGHELTVTLPPEPVYLKADLVRLAQVFLNLLNNAAKYTEWGGRIWLTAEREGDDVTVRVKDTGVGIPADKLPRLFEMFFQVDRTLERSQGGLGIGLSLVRRLVELHGGRVEACSEGVGKGSEFIVRLPVFAEKPQHPQSHEPSANGEKKAISARRILVVDDNRDAANSLALLLQLAGNEVRTGYDGLEGVETAEGFRPDVVLLDIGMPKLNGHDACRRIREEAWGKDMVLVGLTGWGQEEDRRRTIEAGFDAHVVKPVDPTALLQLLASLSAEKGQLTTR